MQNEYLQELGYLRRLAQELADEYPEISDVASGAGDEAADRLFQGAALLLGRLRLRIEDQTGAVLVPLFSLCWPQYLRPIPSLTMVQFALEEGAFHQVQHLESETPLKSERIEGESCFFETAAQVHLNPITLSSVALTRPRPSDLVLSLEFSLPAEVPLDAMGLQRLRIHFGGTILERYRLFYWFHHHAEKLTFLDDADQPIFTWPASAIRPIGFDEEESLWPARSTPLPGLLALEEFLVFPEKFLGFELLGLDALGAQAFKERLSERFTINVHLGDISLTSWEPQVGHFLTGCAPARNIGPQKRIELDVSSARTEFRLTTKPSETLFSIERVRALDTKTGHWTNYQPLMSNEAGEGHFFEAVYRPDGLKSDQCYIVTLDETGRPTPPKAEKLSVMTRTTNGILASRLKKGALNLPTSQTPTYVTFENIQKVNPPKPSAKELGRLTALFALFSAPLIDTVSVDGLNAAMELVHYSPGLDPIERILDIEVRSSVRLEEAGAISVMIADVTLDPDAFSSLGELHLFGMVLHRILNGLGGEGLSGELHLRAASLKTPLVYK